MDFFRALYEYGFLQHAMAAAVLSGIVCGIIGTYIVARRMVFLSGGITHASFGGIGIAYYFGLNPILGALVFAVMSSLGIEWGARKGKIREDSAIGMVWSFGMAVGVIFVYLTPGYAPNLMSFLFGNILTVTTADIVALGCLVAVLLLLAFCFLRTVMYVAFDAQFARSRGGSDGNRIVCHGGIGGARSRLLHPERRHRSSHLAAHRSGGHRQLLHQILHPHGCLVVGRCRNRQHRRTVPQLRHGYSRRSRYNISAGAYAYNYKTATFA